MIFAAWAEMYFHFRAEVACQLNQFLFVYVEHVSISSNWFSNVKCFFISFIIMEKIITILINKKTTDRCSPFFSILLLLLLKNIVKVISCITFSSNADLNNLFFFRMFDFLKDSTGVSLQGAWKSATGPLASLNSSQQWMFLGACPWSHPLGHYAGFMTMDEGDRVSFSPSGFSTWMHDTIHNKTM